MRKRGRPGPRQPALRLVDPDDQAVRHAPRDQAGALAGAAAGIEHQAPRLAADLSLQGVEGVNRGRVQRRLPGAAQMRVHHGGQPRVHVLLRTAHGAGGVTGLHDGDCGPPCLALVVKNRGIAAARKVLLPTDPTRSTGHAEHSKHSHFKTKRHEFSARRGTLPVLQGRQRFRVSTSPLKPGASWMPSAPMPRWS